MERELSGELMMENVRHMSDDSGFSGWVNVVDKSITLSLRHVYCHATTAWSETWNVNNT